jgi:hypothetical protein
VARSAGRPVPSDEDGQREILNNLLPQIGNKDLIGPSEKPIDAIKRMRQATGHPGLVKNFDICLRWLNQPRVRVKFVAAHSVATGPSVIFDGEEFTTEEFASIRKLADERAISIEEAVTTFRAEQDGA